MLSLPLQTHSTIAKLRAQYAQAYVKNEDVKKKQNQGQYSLHSFLSTPGSSAMDTSNAGGTSTICAAAVVDTTSTLSGKEEQSHSSKMPEDLRKPSSSQSGDEEDERSKPSSSQSGGDEGNTEGDTVIAGIHKHIMESILLVLKQMIMLVKALPAFQELACEDQASLIKGKLKSNMYLEFKVNFIILTCYFYDTVQ